MDSSHRSELFVNYHKHHISYLDINVEDKLEWFMSYVDNYTRHLTNYNKETAAVLEIGCNQGYLLKALSKFGFKNLHGIDLSPVDVEIARQMIPDAELECGDAFDYLESRPEKFDVIILKAVLEHIEKKHVVAFLQKISYGLTRGGLVIVDVPNMDWLFASHERYMDFTHETGFTKESLRQILNTSFNDVKIFFVDHGRSNFMTNLKKNLARFLLGRLLSWADPEGGSNPIWMRSIIGTGVK